MDGTFEQDLVVFTLRDMLIQYLTGVTLTGCGGGLEAIAEGQDYEHGNMYHYIVDFVCNYIEVSISISHVMQHCFFIYSSSCILFYNVLFKSSFCACVIVCINNIIKSNLVALQN